MDSRAAERESRSWTVDEMDGMDGWRVSTLSFAFCLLSDTADALSFRSPYTRATYRYTPLLAVLLSPIHILPSPLGPIFGKLIFSFVSSFTIPNLLLRLSNAEQQGNSSDIRRFIAPNWLIHGIWTLNPIILNINTRGSSEALLVVLVLGALVALKEERLRTCAILWGASIHWKLYPVVYASSLFVVLQRMDAGRLWTRRKVEFGLWSVGTVGVLSFVSWLM